MGFATQRSFNNILYRRGADITYHREGNTVPCPCRTPEGYRDPEFHQDHPEIAECNAEGFLVSPLELVFKGIVQPALGGRRGMQSITEMFGEIKTDDHIGLFPTLWIDIPLNFADWSHAGDEFVEYNGMRFTLIAWSLIPDPHDPSVGHHWECALRRINKRGFGPEAGY